MPLMTTIASASAHAFSAPAAPTWQTIFTASLNTDNGPWNGNTVAVPIPIANLSSVTGTPSQIRVTLQAGNGEGLTIAAAYIGHRGGADPDFAATPVQLLASGSGNLAMSAAAQLVTDGAAFVWDKVSGITVAMQVASANDTFRTATVSGVTNYYKAGTDAATVDKSGYSTGGASCVGIAKIEVLAG